jgi:hypothetical protein
VAAFAMAADKQNTANSTVKLLLLLLLVAAARRRHALKHPRQKPPHFQTGQHWL